jgi:tubulin polyglutamylase TTLL11
LIASLNPLVVYLNDDGLARFCTEDYEPVTDQNSGNTFMHLTNYTLNKASQGFVHPPENFMDINEATKRTFTSAKKSLHKMGIDVPKLK